MSNEKCSFIKDIVLFRCRFFFLGGREGEETTQRIYPERTAQGDQERTRHGER